MVDSDEVSVMLDRVYTKLSEWLRALRVIGWLAFALSV